jgi:hypothetical protein
MQIGQLAAARSGRALLYAGVGAALLGLNGCMHAVIEQTRELPTAIGSTEAVVILAKPNVEGAGTEDKFMDCVGDGLAGGAHPMRIAANNAFVDDLFPWFEPSTAPTRPEALTELLNRPGVAEKIAAKGVRYVVWVDGVTKKTDGGGSIACGAAPGAAGCLGFGWWEKQSDYLATVWDLQQARSAGSVTTNVTGTSALVGLVVPLPFIARVQGTACNRMAGQLRTFLQGDSAAK